MRPFILLALFLFSATAFAADKPNFVLIFIDDMGYGDIGPFGSKVNRTPNLDQMAAEGMKLTSFYAAPVCSASRAQLLTGSYAPRVSVPGVFFPAGRNGLNPEEHTVADYLKELGYATACVGKWHLGDQREFLPTRHGFDSYFGIPYSNDMQRVATDNGKRVHPVMRNEEVEALIEDEEQRFITRQYTEEAVSFIKEKSDSDDPFFLYMPHTAMHVPIFPHKDFVGKSSNGRYGDWIAEVDWSVGQILQTLKDQKIDDNTLVIFTSDNGPWASKGTDGGGSGPLRGAKGCTLEGGVREPTLVRWPGKIKAGTTSDTIAGTTDVLPTLVSLAGGKVKDDIKIDGFDLSQVMLGQAEDSGREAWYYFSGTKLQAVRSGPWKLAVTGQSIGMGFKEKPSDLAAGGRLYNLDEEIGEVTNLAAENPEVVTRLQKLADAMAVDIAKNARPAGVVENPVTLYPTVPRPPRKKSNVKTTPIDWNKVKAGEVYQTSSAPQIANKPFTITCTIEGDNPTGVIVSHGGTAVGYTLYTMDGSVTLMLRQSQTSVARITNKLESSRNMIIASVKKDGSMHLTVNENPPLVAAEPHLKTLGKHPLEDLSIGHDSANPVDSRAPKEAFTGKISSLKITVD